MPTTLPILSVLFLFLFLHNSVGVRPTVATQEKDLSKVSKVSSVDYREYRLKLWAEYLFQLEKHLDEREAYLRQNVCPYPPRKTHPKLCEYCVRRTPCANGLTCRDRKCQRLKGPNPVRCPDEESCGPGQQRRCSKLRSSDFGKPGELRKKLVDRDFFVGKTDFIPDCVMGKVKIDCAKREEICKKEFCIIMTLEECRRDGLVEGDLEGRETDECCVKAVPLDCFVSKLCRCVAKRPF